MSKEEEKTPEEQRRAKMDELFTAEKYKANEVGGKEFFFADGADALAQRNFVITIQHVPSGKIIKFKAFLTAFNDTFSQDWNSEPVYGRADPLYNFKQTTRRISIGFQMPAASESEAYENLAKAQQLSQFMYPNYSNFGTDKFPVRTLSQGPLLRLKVMNLLQTTVDSVSNAGGGPKDIYSSYGPGGDGMLGFCNDVTFNFNLEGDKGVFQKSDGTILPKLIEVNIGGFSPIHEHHLGWDDNNIFAEGRQFPYGAQGAGDDSEPAGTSYSAQQRKKDERAQAEAAIANAEARYGGMFGDARRKRDQRKIDQGKYSDSKTAYVKSALLGAASEKDRADAFEDAAAQRAVDEVFGDSSYAEGGYNPYDFL